jgi:hypothetical protein
MISTFQRSVVAVDPDGAKVPTWPVDGTDSLSLYALSAVAGSTITVRLLAFTSPGNLAAISPSFVFTASATADFAGQFSGTPSAAVWMEITGVTLCGVKVDAITGGPWLIGATALKQGG